MTEEIENQEGKTVCWGNSFREGVSGAENVRGR